MQNNILTQPQHFLVTGANGFIGTRLSQILKQQGHYITALIRNPDHASLAVAKLWDQIVIHDFTANKLDLNKFLQLPQHNFTGFFHLANIAHSTSSLTLETYWNTNVNATLDLWELAIKIQPKAFIYLSSVKAVAEPSTSIPINEDFTTWPTNNDLYGLSKRMAEELLLRAATSSKINCCILRPSLVYGPGVKGHLALLIKAAKRQLLPKMPDLDHYRSMVHIDDLVTAMLLAATNSKARDQIFIVTDQHKYRIREIFSHLTNQTRKQSLRHYLLNLVIQSIAIPYWILWILAKFGDAWHLLLNQAKMINLITAKQAKNNFYLNTQTLQKLTGSSNFTADRLIKELNWHPKYSFFDFKI